MKEPLKDFMNRVEASIDAGDLLTLEDQERVFNIARRIAILTEQYLAQLECALGDEL